MKYKFYILLCTHLLLHTVSLLFASEFDELDKAPEGMHKDQIIILGSISIGAPYGELISAEEKFTKTSTYTFENEITKLIYLSHLAFGLSISAEYMPIDYIGTRAKIRRSLIVQNTNFGSDYQSWKKTLYSDYSVFFGPSFHATSRKPWDIALSPLIGYAFSTYNPTPIAKKILTSSSQTYIAPPSQQYSQFVYGVDMFLSIFFSSGFVIQFGAEWLRNTVIFSTIPDAVNPQTNQVFFNKKSAIINSILLCISAGYAFYN